MLIYALIVTAGLGALFIPCLFLRNTLAHKRHSSWRIAAIIMFVSLALIGSTLFCYDLWFYRKFWADDSTAIAALNFVGILMINAHLLFPTLLCFFFLYFKRFTGADKKSTSCGSVADS